MSVSQEAIGPIDSSSGNSYRQILKATAMIGGSSIVNIAFAIIRNKATALMLGPQGVGLMGLYGSIADLAQNLGGLGVQASGVRQIAEAVGSGDEHKIAMTAIVLRRISVVLGIVAALLLCALALPIASFTFADQTHAAGVALLALVVLFRLISAGQTALVQGMRRIGDLARLNMLGALFSTLIGIPLIYLFGEKGIVPALVAMAAVSVLTSWWYSRKIRIAALSPSIKQVREELTELFKLGVVFMVSGFLTVGAAYAVRIIVLRQSGVEAAGLYQAAWALGGLYASFILQAMGTDFYPRLTAISRDNAQCNRLVNDQIQISVLLAGPGLLATLTLAPLVISLFYSSQFHPAINLLRWICLGVMLQIVSWPMGFIILAKGARKIFFWTEVAATLVHVGLAWLLVNQFGLIGSGVAFLGLYVWHTAFVYVLVRRLSGFRWSKFNARLVAFFLAVTTLAFVLLWALPFWPATLACAFITCASGLFSLRMLFQVVPAEWVPARIRRWLPNAATSS